MCLKVSFCVISSEIENCELYFQIANLNHANSKVIFPSYAGKHLEEGGVEAGKTQMPVHQLLTKNLIMHTIKSVQV